MPSVLDGESRSESPVLRMSPEIMEPGPSTRAPPNPPESAPTLGHTTPGTLDRPSNPRRSQRRRRLTRQEPLMTQDAARRALIRICDRRANIEEQNCKILRLLLREMKEIKEILQLR